MLVLRAHAARLPDDAHAVQREHGFGVTGSEGLQPRELPRDADIDLTPDQAGSATIFGLDSQPPSASERTSSEADASHESPCCANSTVRPLECALGSVGH